jgi:hypothetical protein
MRPHTRTVLRRASDQTLGAKAVCCVGRGICWLLISGTANEVPQQLLRLERSRNHTHYVELLLDIPHFLTDEDAAKSISCLFVAEERVLQLMPKNTQKKI